MATSSVMTTIWTEKRILQHPFHRHALILRELSKDCQVKCSLCKQYFPGGLTYCCEDCDFILQEACALVEFPPVIEEHPYHHHPGHPLNLVAEFKTYHCSADCGFSLDVLTALATRLLPQDVDEAEELDGIHVHRLSSFRVETVLPVNCHLCRNPILGQVYGCQSCLHMLHEVCARLDLEIQHPLHCQHPLTFLMVGDHTNETFECKACRGPITLNSDPGYNCKECEFALHFECTIATMNSSSAIKHFSHKHPLTPLHVPVEFSCLCCPFCRLEISGAEAYACIDCSFFVHKSCVENLPEEILQYPFHPQHPRLLLREEGSGECDSCSKDIDSDIAFSCGDCEFNLHRSCALQPLSSILEDAASAYISHYSHEHPLRLALFGYINITRHCEVCDGFIGGVGYGCFTCQDFSLHRSCANLPQKLQHEFHPQHPLVLSKVPARHFFCFACHKEHEGGMAFYCVKCQFYMGEGCTSSNTTLKHPRHEHCLAYYMENTTELQCSCCDKRCRYDFYCCMRCNFSLHRDCFNHLPPTIDHKSHRHPLQLRYKFVYGRPDDQYCDYCEMIRNPDHGVYRCEECDYSAHIECMISSYKEEKNGSVTIGSDKSNQLHIEIASVKADMETKRRDLKAMEANLEISLDTLPQFQKRVKLINNKHFASSRSMVPFFHDKGLRSIFHEHPLNMRIISDNCRLHCHICMEYFHGPCYCCEACDFFLHGSCAVLEVPLEIQHPYHPNHPLTLSLGDYQTRAYYYCCECKDDKHLEVLTMIATLPPQDDEELNQDAYEDEHNPEEGKGKDREEEAVMTVVVEEGIIRHFTHEEQSKEDEDEVVAAIVQHFAQKEHCKEEEVVAVMATTAVTVEDEGIIQHFSHMEHPLVSFHVEMQLHDRCGLCAKPIFGQVYGCRECIFLLHASCVVSPSMIHHHPFGSGLTLAKWSNYADLTKCRICEDYIVDGFFIYCLQDGLGESILTLHMSCALSTGFPRGHSYAYSSEFKLHLLHPSPLVFFHIEPTTYSPVKCRLCLLEISGEALGCPEDGFTLHKSCVENLPEVLHHFLHSEHSLKLMQEPMGSDYRCGICQGSFWPMAGSINMVFQCDICEFYLHHDCALQTLSAIEEGAAANITHFAHHHPLQLCLIASEICVACHKRIAGLAYCCPTCRDTSFHKSCAELPRDLDHMYHPKHLLVLLTESPTGNFHCSICLEESRGYAYYCAKCEFYLDLKCAIWNLTLKHPRHEHRLTYFKSGSRKSCNVCGKMCKKDLYSCMVCDFRLHYDCFPLPPKIKHEGHRLHSLFLKDKFVDSDPNYQYCDHCETLRNPEHGVYHCGECWFSAHIDCMIPKVEVQEKELEVLENERDRLELEEAKLSSAGEVIDLSRMTIDTTRGSLEALMEKLRELQVEKESLSSS